jgi:hypothetical protein
MAVKPMRILLAIVRMPVSLERTVLASKRMLIVIMRMLVSRERRPLASNRISTAAKPMGSASKRMRLIKKRRLAESLRYTSSP